MKAIKKHILLQTGALSVAAVLLFSGSLVYAASKTPNTSNSSTNASPIVQSFNAPSGVYPGMLVSADAHNPGSVIALTKKNIEYMLGVVVPVNNAQISITPSSGSSAQVLVAETGRYNVLVSSEGGSITTGEDLTMSSFEGVAKKASPSDQTSIGQAEGNFNGKTGVISEVKVKTGTGAQATYAIGSIPVDVHLSQNNQYIPSSSGLPQFVIQAAYTIAKKPVSPSRIYLGFIIIFAIILIVSTMFYSATRNGIISIGRNPLSRKSIAKGLTQTIIAGLFVFGIGIALVYIVIVI